ncbi:sigma-70 family RNA polymerase sigma factor [Candidatus Nomurabacteria bacterium]|nr:sigma-70 family RNA polymerase sigma factor [Candidatus Nomurabacteria bacterium]
MIHTSSLTSALETVKGSFVITDSAGRAVYANDACYRATGFDIPQVIGQKPGNLWGGHMKKEFYRDLWKKISHERSPFSALVVNKRKDGSGYEQMTFFSPVHDSKSFGRYYLAVSQTFEGNESMVSFQKEFHEMLGQKELPARDVIAWMFSWWNIKNDYRVAREIEDLSFYEAIDTFLVSPNRQKFADRRTDAQLVLQAQHSAQAFATLYTKYADDILWYVYHRLGKDIRKAEEIMQETFLRAFEHLEDFRSGNATYKTYLLRIAHNLLVNHYRKKHIYVPLDDQDVTFGDDTFSRMMVDEMFERAQKILSGAEYKVFVMKYQQGYSVREIATFLGKTENAVKLQLSRGRKKLL